MSERLSRILRFPSLRSASIRRGSISSPTPTARRPWKSTITTSPFLRVSIFMIGRSYISVNLILLFDDDFVAEGRVRLAGRRLEHVRRVHRAAAGDALTVGVAG